MRRHPQVGVLMTIIARTSAAHLFLRQGEEVTLDEYGDLLEGSLIKDLKECIFIARTKPSDWYAPGDIGARIREYFNKQKELKRKLGDKSRIRRYIILPQKMWDNDPEQKRLIDDHKNSEVELYHCDIGNLPSTFPCNDNAVFIDKKDKKWAVEGLNFDENTIQRYLSSALSIQIKVRIEDDQAVLDNWYTHMLSTLERNSKQLAP